MTPIALFVLAALVAEYLLHRTADALNLSSLSPKIPSAFADVIDAEAYAKSQEYTRAKTRFAWVPATFSLIVTLAFWFAGGFEWTDELVRGWGYGPLVTGLLYIGLLCAASTLISLPFSAYSTFVIEERFGFNRTTVATFIADLLKGVLVGVLLGGPLLAAILWFFQETGNNAWWIAWVVAASFVVAIQFVAPAWIMPLFYKFESLEAGELKDAMLGYAGKVGFGMDDVYVIDGSRRSAKANAFFTGIGAKRRVALYDTLIEKHTTDELVAVVAHEIGHFKCGHIVKGMILSILQMGVVFFCLGIAIRTPELFEAFGVTRPSVWVGLVLFSLLWAPLSLGLSILMTAFSRKNEFEADAFARKTLGDGEVLAKALEKLSVDSLSNLTPHPFYVRLHYSHPPLSERLAALRA